MSIPPMLTTPNSMPSRTNCGPRCSRKVQCRLPIQFGGDDLREDRTFVDVIGVEDRRPQQVEDAQVDHQADASDEAEAHELRDELAHREWSPRFRDNGLRLKSLTAPLMTLSGEAP
jgi:hypothetical protein